MHFYVRKRRNTPTVIIVALIDVLIVLVIFLLVTTTFKQTSALKLALPESSQSKKSGANENPPFVVNVDKNGVYSVNENGHPLPVTFEQFVSKLKARVLEKPDTILAINADENAPWGKIVKIHDAATDAKVKTLTAFTKEPAKP
jgi:biopolymer transport protein ExbD